jgi:hypothetical protein
VTSAGRRPPRGTVVSVTAPDPAATQRALPDPSTVAPRGCEVARGALVECVAETVAPPA